ncbi:6-phospho-3-hexuloisomerase [Streptomyces fulvoviolaceus]|uniref:6-phospho-3-hexuloisomerase n=1 Tax=Streptomyces fulvoviolaceus TaxID=285535 RepID=UPI0004CA2083|nr:6-phospho-3-hexuloisomerase [Streptomyces fulvoviolaceus]MCT9080870.1 SIS domain-containing protein [Streptomyces fulvoviolaceus]
MDMDTDKTWLAVGREVGDLLGDVDETSFDAVVTELLTPGRRWFATGQGRSGLVASMTAMRLMHLGQNVHVLGEATAPSVESGDGLIVISGSGETPVSVHYARRARAHGARILAVTARPSSTLVELADVVLRVPSRDTAQFSGSLFEQGALLVLDAVVMALTAGREGEHARMQARHTNMQ